MGQLITAITVNPKSPPSHAANKTLVVVLYISFLYLGGLSQFDMISLSEAMGNLLAINRASIFSALSDPIVDAFEMERMHCSAVDNAGIVIQWLSTETL